MAKERRKNGKGTSPPPPDLDKILRVKRLLGGCEVFCESSEDLLARDRASKLRVRLTDAHKVFKVLHVINKVRFPWEASGC